MNKNVAYCFQKKTFSKKNTKNQCKKCEPKTKCVVKQTQHHTHENIMQMLSNENRNMQHAKKMEYINFYVYIY